MIATHPRAARVARRTARRDRTKDSGPVGNGGHDGHVLAGEGGFLKLPRNLGPGAPEDVHALVDPPRE